MSSDWEDAPAAASSVASGGWEDAPATPPETLKQPPRSGARDFAGSLAALADLPLSLPGAMVGVGASLGSTLAGAAAKPWTGQSWKDIYAKALEQGGEVTEKLINPMQKILRAFGVEKEYEDAPVTKALGFVAEKIGEGTQQLEKATGMPAEGLQILANEIMTLGIPGAGKAARKAVRSLTDVIAERVPAAERTARKISDATVDDILAAYEKETGNPEKLTRDDIRTKTDADLNAEARAYELMQRGASKKEVEGIRKKNPLVGEKLDEMMARRAEIMRGPMKDVLQGEVLGPEMTAPDQPVLPERPGVRTTSEQPALPELQLSLEAPAQTQLPGAPRKLPGNREAGGVDPELLTAIAAVGGSAALGATLNENPAAGAFLGGLVGLGLHKAVKSGLPKNLDYLLGSTSTRVQNISKPVWHRAIAHEQQVLENTHKAIAGGDPFLTKLNKLAPDVQAELNNALLQNDFTKVNSMLRRVGDPQLAADFVALRKELSAKGKELQSVGLLKNLRTDYFPRMVRDREGLLNSLGLELRNHVQKQLAAAEAKAIQAGEAGLSDEVASAIINEALRKGPTGQGKPGFTKQRVLQTITPEMEQFYYPPTETFHTYMERATKAVERERFFGKDAVRSTNNGVPQFDLEASVGKLVARELKAGSITPDQVPELASLLTSRFAGGERTPSKFLQDARNYGNTALLGDLTSGLVQAGDAIMSVYQSGLRPTLKSLYQQLTGKSHVNVKDFGLANHVSEDFVGTTRSAKVLNMVLGPVFRPIDTWGKTTVLNAAINKAQQSVKTPKGLQQLGQKYAEAFGEDFPRLVEDLKSGEITPQVKLLAFHELSNLQPVSKLEMPQGYLDHPDARIMYMLKGFQLKQLDLLRREAYQQIRKGKVPQGFANLARLGTALGIAGATTSQVRDWILGIDSSLEASDVLDNALKTYGWSKYVQDKVAEGKPAEAMVGLVAPPYKVIDHIVSRDPRAISYIPWFGKTLYHRELGGAERAENYRRKQREQTQ